MRLRGLGAFCIAAVAASVTGWGAELDVVVDGVRNDRGDIVLSVYASPEQWPDGKSVTDLKEEAKLGSVTFKIHDLPPGTYGVTAFHDENRNGKLDTGFMGIPSEGFGASNDAPEKFGPPKYADARFTVTGDQTLTIHMTYVGM